MKKKLNLVKWIGPIFGSIVFFLMIIIAETKNTSVLGYLVIFILPIFSYCFTMMYLRSIKSTITIKLVAVFQTILLITSVISLGLAGYVSLYPFMSAIPPYTISIISAYLIPLVSMIFGVEQIFEREEDNFLYS